MKLTAAVLLAAATSALADPPQVLDLNPSSREQAFSFAVSSDGRAVVGYTRASPVTQNHAYRWTLDDAGVVHALDLGALHSTSRADDLSADGSVVIGVSDGAAYRWTSAAGLAPIPPLPGGVSTVASFISDDGLTIFGYCSLSGRTDVPYLWRSPASAQEVLPPPGFTQIYVQGLSADGQTLVGSASAPNLQRAVIWTGGGDHPVLLPAPADSATQAIAVSGDGSVIAGSIDGQAVRWTRNGSGVYELRSLPLMPDGLKWIARDISDSGDVIGGEAYQSPIGFRACLWSRATGPVYLVDELRDLGADVSMWKFDFFRGLSADGSAATAIAVNTRTQQIRAVLIRGLPVPPVCGPDFNGDGLVDFFDYNDFVAAFEAGDPSADYSRDGFVDYFDYLDFVADFETGC